MADNAIDTLDRWWERPATRDLRAGVCGESDYRAAVRAALVASVDGGSIQALEAHRQRAIDAIAGMDSAGLRGYPSELFHAVSHWAQGEILLRHSLSGSSRLEDGEGDGDADSHASPSP